MPFQSDKMSDEDMNMTLSDEENEIQDLQQLNAALGDDEPSTSASTSQYTSTAESLFSDSSKYEQRSKIESALALNYMCDEKLRRLEKILINRLMHCRERLRDIQRLPHEEVENKTEIFYYVSCGRPYFKDSSNFPAPDNEDTILMNRSEMYDFSNIASVSGWTIKDKGHFLNLLHTMSQEIKKKELNSNISELKRKMKSSPSKRKEIEKKIAALKSQIGRVNKMSLDDLALPIDQDYDWYAIANKLNKRHIASEYRALWRLFLHPSINKKPWSKAEHVQLQKIAFEQKLQNWDRVSERLGTGRTNYQCFVYFRTNMSNTFTGRKWTKEEVEYLKRLINYYREDKYIPWGKVATSMENRTKIQIYNKYLGLCQQRKGRFLPEEDTVILTCVEKFGPNYQKITQYLPGRTSSQCRVRYQVLAKRRISTVWTTEEDKRLIQLMANQDSETNYSSVTKYFPGKDRVHIRTRFLTLTKWMRRNPNVDIAKAPRRGARRLGHGHSTVDLNKAIEALKHRIQSEVNDVKSKKLTINSPVDMIDDAITVFLANENAKLEEAKHIEALKALDADSELEHNKLKLQLSENVNNLRKILILLRAKLNKTKFTNSSKTKKYKGLLEPDPEFLKPQVKSYSKISKINNVNINGVPDIWGNEQLGPLEYVLPPHYATITGCKKLMSYIATKPKNDDIFNVRVILRKNLFLKEQIFLLMERFNALFLWPMLLSNAPPDPSIQNRQEPEVMKQSTVQPVKAVYYDEEDYNLAMPYFIKSDVVNEIIDLNDLESPDHTCIGKDAIDLSFHHSKYTDN